MNALRKDEPIQVNKNFMEKMFAKMIKDIMKKHNTLTVEQLSEMAQEQDIEKAGLQENYER